MGIFEEFAKNLIESAKNQPPAPKSPAEWLADGELGEWVVWTATADAQHCPCGGTDGFVLVVARGAAAQGHKIGPADRISFNLFDHRNGDAQHVLMSAEQAKQLVNRLGEAISLAERIDAEEAR